MKYMSSQTKAKEIWTLWQPAFSHPLSEKEEIHEFSSAWGATGTEQLTFYYCFLSCVSAYSFTDYMYLSLLSNISWIFTQFKCTFVCKVSSLEVNYSASFQKDTTYTMRSSLVPVQYTLQTKCIHQHYFSPFSMLANLTFLIFVWMERKQGS